MDQWENLLAFLEAIAQQMKIASLLACKALWRAHRLAPESQTARHLYSMAACLLGRLAVWQPGGVIVYGVFSLVKCIR